MLSVTDAYDTYYIKLHDLYFRQLYEQVLTSFGFFVFDLKES